MSARKTERLLNLVILLMSGRRGYTKQELFDNIALYREAPTPEAREKLFDRDKAMLREQGIPIESFSDDAVFENDNTHRRYRINSADYRLPPVRFTPEEGAVLTLAARMWEQASLGSAAARALRKLQARGVDAGPGPLASLEPRIRTSEPHFDIVLKATAERRPLRFGYRTANADVELTRTVEPWGVGSRFGHWYVVGLDKDRGQERCFRLSRISTAPKVLPGAVQVPADFDVRHALNRLSEIFPSRPATLDLEPGAAFALRPVESSAAAGLPGAGRITGRLEPGGGDGGWDRLHTEFTDVDEFADRVAVLAISAVVREPQELRDAVVGRLHGARRACHTVAAEPEFPARGAEAGHRKSSATEHLTRLLDLVPYVISRPGVDLAETAQLFGVSNAQLIRDLDLLFVSGPQLYPDELMDVSYEDNRIFIENAERLSEPVRFSMDEACALIVGLETLATLPGLASRSMPTAALTKLSAAAGAASGIGTAVATRLTDQAQEHTLALLEDAVSRQRQLRLSYLVPHRDEITQRTVDPVRVFSQDDAWYLDAWCHRADARRVFRLDRIRDLTVTDADAEQHEADEELRVFSPGDDDARVVVLLDQEARWVAQAYYADRTAELPDGRLAAELRIRDTGWVPGLAARLGGRLTIQSPDRLRFETAAWLDRALAAYDAVVPID